MTDNQGRVKMSLCSATLVVQSVRSLPQPSSLPITKVGPPILPVVTEFENKTAFNTIFAMGIALTTVTIALSLAVKNYTFTSNIGE